MGKFFQRFAADPAGGRVGRGKFRELFFQFFKLGVKPVVFAVGDFRFVQDIVKMVMPLD